MYIKNRRNSSKSNGCIPLQNCNGLISLKPAIAYFAYTNRSPTIASLGGRTGGCFTMFSSSQSDVVEHWLKSMASPKPSASPSPQPLATARCASLINDLKKL